MTNEEILKKAIEKANSDAYILSESWLSANYGNISGLAENNNYYSFIFNHDFSKAFWKSDDVRGKTVYSEQTAYDRGFSVQNQCLTCGMLFGRDEVEKIRWGHKDCSAAIDVEWKHHLQQMVLEEEPLKYLERFI